MDEEIKELLDEEIKSRIENLATVSPGTDEDNDVVSNLNTLYKLRLEEKKIDADVDDKNARRVQENARRVQENEKNEREFDLKEQQADEEKKQTIVKLVFGTCEIVIPLIFSAHWLKRGFKFEEDGILTSTTMRGLFNGIFPKKK